MKPSGALTIKKHQAEFLVYWGKNPDSSGAANVPLRSGHSKIQNALQVPYIIS
jgi:formylmethanofuran dehydrogenase subunit B